MKRFFENPLAYIAALVTIALSVAFVIGTSPDILPAPHWHITVDTVANRVTWFGHTGSCNAGFAFLFFLRPNIPWKDTLLSFLGTLAASGFLAGALMNTFKMPPLLAGLIGFGSLFGAGVYDWYKPATGMENVTANDLAKQIWIPQLMEKFYPAGGHLLRSQDMTSWVNYNTINLADAGVDPEVLIDNNAYPIDTDTRTDAALMLTLSRFRTKNTTIRDAEAVELAYNKMESVIKGHRKVLAKTCVLRATYSWTPATNSEWTPVIQTTGAVKADGTKKMTLADISNAQASFDNLDIDAEGRVLVLHPTHYQEIIQEDQGLFKTFANQKAGTILPLNGFDIYKTTATARFNGNTQTKNAFGSAPLNTDVISSLFYLESEVMRADGDVEMFSLLRDPYADGDTIGFAKRFIGLPIRNKAIGAIISGV